MLILSCVFFGGWLLAATIGTWAFFAGSPSLERSPRQEV